MDTMTSKQPNQAVDRGNEPQTCPDLEDCINEASTFIDALDERSEPPTWDEQVKFCFITRDGDALLREAWKLQGYPRTRLLAFKGAMVRAMDLFSKHPTKGKLLRRLDGQERAGTTEEIIDSLTGRLSLVEAIL